jgi:hypothetical protein
MISVISALHECSAQESSSSKGVQEEKELEPKLNKELKDIIKEPIYDERHLMLRQLSIKIAASNPESAWELSKKIPFVPDRIAFSVPLMRQWGREDPLKALERSRDLPDGELRLMVANSALEGWAEKAPLEALQWASVNLSASYRRTAYAQIGEVWVRSGGGAKAADWGMNLSNEIERIFYVAEVLENWAEILPMDAANWVSKLPPGKFHDLMISKAVYVWVQHYPKTAAEWIVLSQDYHWLLPNAVGKWARFDHIAASAWLSLIADEHLSELCHAAIVTEWAIYNPAAAYKWSESNLKGEQLTNARRIILGNWTADYPLEVLIWSQDLKPQEKRMSALEVIFETWSLTDLTACKDWVKKQKAGLEKDICLSRLADTLMESDPEEAAGLALSIENPSVKKMSLTQIIENWKRTEPEKANAWAQKHPNVLNSVKP